MPIAIPRVNPQDLMGAQPKTAFIDPGTAYVASQVVGGIESGISDAAARRDARRRDEQARRLQEDQTRVGQANRQQDIRLERRTQDSAGFDERIRNLAEIAAWLRQQAGGGGELLGGQTQAKPATQTMPGGQTGAPQATVPAPQPPQMGQPPRNRGMSRFAVRPLSLRGPNAAGIAGMPFGGGTGTNMALNLTGRGDVSR